MAHCRQATRNTADAEDLFQTIAIRAWRGHHTYRGAAGYPTWVMRIAERESARFWARYGRLRERETVLPEDLPAATEEPVDAGWIRAVVDAGVLTEVERLVVCARLDTAGASWAQIGERLSITAGNCAKRHLDAVRKLRVHLCVERPDLLGGRAVLAAAFVRAQAAGSLTDAEAAAFREIALENREIRRKGARDALAAACGTVLRQFAVADRAENFLAIR